MLHRLQQFIQLYNGPKLNIAASGGAGSLGLLANVPGCSKILNGYYEPYSIESRSNFIADTTVPQNIEWEIGQDGEPKSVQEGIAAQLAKAAYKKSNDGIGIGVTAGLTTNRFRRGANEAYICKYDPLLGYKVWHTTFEKISEEQFKKLSPISIHAVASSKRNEEDEILSNLVLDILLGREPSYEPCKLVYQSS